MNEVRNILVGFDFGEKVSQLCYYDRREGEPVSLPVKVGTGQYTFPNVLSKKPGEEEWHFGLEVEYFVEQQDEIPVENLYTLCLKQETVEVDGLHGRLENFSENLSVMHFVSLVCRSW